MNERPSYHMLDDARALAWFGPAYACAFGTIVGVLLIATSGLPNSWYLVPPILFVGCLYCIRGGLRHTSREREFYARGVEVTGRVKGLVLERSQAMMDAEFEYGEKPFEARQRIPIAVAEQLRIGGNVMLLVDPENPTRCEVIGPAS